MTLIRLGKTSKMRGYSFGLDARNCITGSKLRKVKGSVCAKCYAMKGNFNFPSVRKNKETNLKHIESEYFVYVMTYQLQDIKYFRWFDSGDLPHLEALKKIVQIAQNTPKTKHWLPTREIKMIQEYLKNNKLVVEDFGRGFAWLDTGTHESLIAAGQFIQTIEKRQGLKVGCLEEIAYENGLISKKQLLKQAQKLKNTTYGDYLSERYSQ